MNNCLVKTFRSTVNNDSLPKLNCVKVIASTIDNPSEVRQCLNLKGVGVLTVKIVGNGVLATTYSGLESSTLKEYEIPANTPKPLYFSNGDYTIEIYGKYNLTRILCASNDYESSKESLFGANIDELEYSNMDQLGLGNNPNTTGDLSSLEKITSLISINLRSTKITGTLSNIKKLQNISNVALTKTEVSGNIIELVGSSVNSVELANCNNIVGNYEDFLEAMLTSGRTQELRTVFSPHVTLNDVPFGGTVVSSFGDNTITCKNLQGDTLATFNNGTWTYAS